MSNELSTVIDSLLVPTEGSTVGRAERTADALEVDKLRNHGDTLYGWNL